MFLPLGKCPIRNYLHCSNLSRKWCIKPTANSKKSIKKRFLGPLCERLEINSSNLAQMSTSVSLQEQKQMPKYFHALALPSMNEGGTAPLVLIRKLSGNLQKHGGNECRIRTEGSLCLHNVYLTFSIDQPLDSSMN